jgi:hypothetical protein
MKIAPNLSLLFLLGVCSIAGCGASDSVRGTVSYNGEPVEMGTIAFQSADGSGPGFGAEVVNGQYKADKVRRGKHVAVVRGLTKAPPVTKEQFAQHHEQRDNKYGLPVDFIADNAEGNRQTIDVEGGAQTFDFEIKGPPRPRQ